MNYFKSDLKGRWALYLTPLLCAVIFYCLYDFSLQSSLTFIVYNGFALGAFILLCSFIRKLKSLIRPVIIFVVTYLSVYVISLAMHLNTSWFDFIKGCGFTLIAFTACALLKWFASVFYGRAAGKLSAALFYVALLLAVLLPGVFIGYFIATGSLISSDIIIALAQTNLTEGTEFFQSNANVRWYLAFAALAVIYALNAFAFKRGFDAVKKRTGAALSLLATLIFAVFLVLPRMDYLPFSVVKVTSRQLDNFEVYKQKKALREAKLKELSSLKVVGSEDGRGRLYVLVIGESETSDRMQAYGFERENTPLLNEALKSPNNILLKHAYSSWPQTVQALTYALTQANQYNHIDGADAYSLIEVARAAGFDTYWLSNQRKYGMYETPITVISSTASHEIWTNGSSKMEGVFFDEELLRRFPKIDDKKNTLIIVHLMGSHQKYDKRLPNEYKKFTGDDSTLDYYDDTVLYTDYIVNEIYKKASSVPSFGGMVYFSDHGEDPHVVGGHDPVNVCWQMLKVPCVVYLSDAFVRERQDVYSALRANQERHFSNDLIFNLMVNLMGIEGQNLYEHEYSPGSDEYSLNEETTLTMYGKKHINAPLHD